MGSNDWTVVSNEEWIEVSDETESHCTEDDYVMAPEMYPVQRSSTHCEMMSLFNFA